MAGLEKILLQHPFFRGLETRLGALVAGCCRNVLFEAGGYLLREGAAAQEFYLVRQGSVALEVSAPGRPAIVFLTLGKDEIVGASWLAPPYRWTCDARAVNPVHALGIDAQCLRNKCEADHDLGYELLKRCQSMLIRRLHATRLQLLDVYGGASP
ncbi:MAG TPA: cyclic nucleotide-binding domain-containing protein [Steroidobacteraceae bacterium]|nr:cyclic nucleotide-binding domain-containing protein [Steroidobacteraceae bacterium]